MGDLNGLIWSLGTARITSAAGQIEILEDDEDDVVVDQHQTTNYSCWACKDVDAYDEDLRLYEKDILDDHQENENMTVYVNDMASSAGGGACANLWSLAVYHWRVIRLHRVQPLCHEVEECV